MVVHILSFFMADPSVICMGIIIVYILSFCCKHNCKCKIIIAKVHSTTRTLTDWLLTHLTGLLLFERRNCGTIMNMVYVNNVAEKM